jgi:AcrR family transcriptional regulator
VRNDVIILLLTTALSFPLGLALGQAWLLPVLNALPVYVVLVHRLRKGERGGAVRTAIWWAGMLALTGTTCLAVWPAETAPLVLGGPEYLERMLDWIRTGGGPESMLNLFLPRQLLQLAVFAALSLTTASALSVVMGAWMLNYVSFYVAGALLGWQPWTISRLAAFCTLGVVLAEPFLLRLSPSAQERLNTFGRAPYYVAALSGIVAGWVLQALLAPLWVRWLHALVP